MWIHPHTMASHQIFLSKTGNNFYVDVSLSKICFWLHRRGYLPTYLYHLSIRAPFLEEENVFPFRKPKRERDQCFPIKTLQKTHHILLKSRRTDKRDKNVCVLISQTTNIFRCLPFQELILMLQAYHSFITHPPCLSLPNSNCSKRLGQTH